MIRSGKIPANRTARRIAQFVTTAMLWCSPMLTMAQPCGVTYYFDWKRDCAERVKAGWLEAPSGYDSVNSKWIRNSPYKIYKKLTLVADEEYDSHWDGSSPPFDPGSYQYVVTTGTGTTVWQLDNYVWDGYGESYSAESVLYAEILTPRTDESIESTHLYVSSYSGSLALTVDESEDTGIITTTSHPSSQYSNLNHLHYFKPVTRTGGGYSPSNDYDDYRFFSYLDIYDSGFWPITVESQGTIFRVEDSKYENGVNLYPILNADTWTLDSSFQDEGTLSDEFTTDELKGAVLAAISLPANWTRSASLIDNAAEYELAPEEMAFHLCELEYRFVVPADTKPSSKVSKGLYGYMVSWDEETTYEDKRMPTKKRRFEYADAGYPETIVGPFTAEHPAVEKGVRTFTVVNNIVISPLGPGQVHAYGDDSTGSGCQSCGVGASGIIFGSRSETEGGRNVWFSLGTGTNGAAVGSIVLPKELATNTLSNPASLQWIGITNEIALLTNSSSGVLQQAAVSDGLVNLDVLSAYKYELQFYTNGTFATGLNGQGVHDLTGQPFVKWLVENPDGAGAVTNLYISEIRGSSVITNAAVWVSTNQAWTSIPGNELQRQSVLKQWNPTNLVLSEIIELRSTQSNLVSCITNKYSMSNYVSQLIERHVGTGSTMETSTYAYDSAGRLQQQINPDGSWEYQVYDSSNRVTIRYSGFGNQGVTTNPALCRSVEYDYSTNVISGAGDNGTLEQWSPRRTIEKLLGHEVGRSYLVVLPNERREILCQTIGAAYNASDNLVTTSKSYSTGWYTNMLASVEQPEGSMTFYNYSTNSTQIITTITQGQPGTAKTNIVDGIRTVNVEDLKGRQLSSSRYDILSGLQTGFETNNIFDGLNRVLKRTYLDGTYEEFGYSCCGLETHRDRDGTVTSYDRDDLKRVTSTTKNGVSMISQYDAAGRVLVSQRMGTNGATITLNQATYDLNGSMVASTNALNGATTYSSTTNGNGEKVVTTTYPDGGTRIETYFKDGSLKSLTGTAVQPVRYEYGIESESGTYREYTKSIKLGAAPGYADTSEWTKTYTDTVGRTYKTVFAGTGSPYLQSWYNTKGQLWKQRDPDGVVTLTSYDSQGRPFYQAVDVNQNDVINTNGLDRVTFTLSDVVSAHSTTVRRTRTYAHLVDNSTSFDLLSMSEQSVDGLKSWQTVYRDASTPVQSSTVTAYPGSGQRTTTATSPNGAYSISLYSYGVMQSVNRYANGGASIGSTTYGYDQHGRVNAVTDARNGTTSLTFNNADQPLTTTSPPPGNGQGAQVTATVYDNMGRVLSVTHPDGSTTSNEYFVSGQLKKTYGSRTYPVEYTYDSQGRMKTMKTWQDFTGNSGTATTTWNYDSYRGWLLSKDYPDASTGAAGTVGPDYGYSPAGRLTTNQWARIVSGSTRLTKTITYGTGGDVSTISYNDSGATPSETFNYDRFGRKKTVISNGITNSFLYNLASQLTEESWSGGTLNTWKVNPYYDTYLRRNQLKVTKLTTLQIQHDYSYDNASRLQKVWQGSYSANYTYEANSSLIDKVEYKYNSTTTRLTADRTYDKLNRLTSMANTPQSGIPVSFAYQYNDANQRIHTTLADGSYRAYEYDSLGQVVSGRRFWSDNTPVAGQQFQYQFDDIGNRKSGGAGGDSNGYGLRGSTNTVNRLNQYTSRTVPGGFDILGVSTATSSVSVNSLTAERKGEYFWKQVDVSNSSAPVWKTNTISVTGVSSVTGKSWVSQTPESYTHDTDGNLTADGRWNYTWDGENRLIRMVAKTVTGPQQRMDFEYDYMGRRIRKKVWNNTAGTGSPATDLKFIYDGWNLMAEVDSTDALVRQYMWGLDLSGTFQGAGGVGGLVKFFDHSTTVHSFVACDGNGNVALLVRGDTGAVAGNCEYGPFGELIRTTGYATSLPFRFSTKYRDTESDLLYYGYRYYQPSTARWLSRDPIGERGGKNYYSFVDNKAVERVDVRGLTHYDFQNDTYYRRIIFAPGDTLVFPDGTPVVVDSGNVWPFADGSNLAKLECILKKLGFVLPKPTESIYMATFNNGAYAWTLEYGILPEKRPVFFETSRTSQLNIADANLQAVVMWHEIVGHNVNNEDDGPAFNLKYEAPVIAKINAFKQSNIRYDNCIICWNTDGKVYSIKNDWDRVLCDCKIEKK